MKHRLIILLALSLPACLEVDRAEMAEADGNTTPTLDAGGETGGTAGDVSACDTCDDGDASWPDVPPLGPACQGDGDCDDGEECILASCDATGTTCERLCAGGADCDEGQACIDAARPDQCGIPVGQPVGARYCGPSDPDGGFCDYSWQPVNPSGKSIGEACASDSECRHGECMMPGENGNNVNDVFGFCTRGCDCGSSASEIDPDDAAELECVYPAGGQGAWRHVVLECGEVDDCQAFAPGWNDCSLPPTGTGTIKRVCMAETTFAALYDGYFQECKQCHAPGAPGRTSDIEQSLNFGSRSTAYSTLQGAAAGLQGNQAGCNGVPFIASGEPDDSLVLAVLGEDVRAGFDVQTHPDCDQGAISDMTLKVGFPPTPRFVAALTGWIAAGAPED
ncbi:MAG: hypothetical protein ACQEXJ_18965 [Myxococcota bacterium]